MKRISVCLCIALIPLFSLLVTGINIDGNTGNKEWKNSVICELIKRGDQSNCDVDMASLLYMVDKNEYSLFLGLKYSVTDYSEENNLSAIEIYVNGLKSAVFYANGNQSYIDYENFDAEHAFKAEGLKGEIECEMRIGIKYGINDDINLGIRIRDCTGRPSNYYEILISDNTNDVSEEVKSENRSEKDESVTVSHKNLSDYEKFKHEKITTKPVITANSAVVSTTEKETVSKTEKTVSSTTMKDTVSEKTETHTEKETEPVATTEQKEGSAENQSEVTATINEKVLEKAEKGKTVGYSVATGLVVSAVFISVITMILNAVKKRKNTDD